MTIRISKIIFVIIIASNITIVAINNLLDYSSNYLFVQHVESMDTTFPENTLKWRAIDSPFFWNVSYIIIITWEFAIMFFCWFGIVKLVKNIKSSDDIFETSKKPAIIGLTLCALLFGFVFITVAGEWFLMWQSTVWNGESSAIKMFMMSGLSLIY
ncbi:MAG TPA: DUF2165 domain-containing protein, partial [Ignavibacteria bacterium]|nr:DUF2165 domain-containing protein [Ignavibacteria bacterium]